MIARLIPFALVLVTAAAGCHRNASPLLADAAPPPSFAKGGPVPSADASHIELDELWRRATGGDPMDLASLADREGAIGLLVGLEQGGDTGLTALHAMPYADDAELAMQRLGEIALQSDGDTQRQVIDAMLAVAGHLVSAREVLDAPGLQSAAAALLELLHSGKATKEVRASAVSTLRLLVDRRVVDPASIPADFDSP